MFLEKTGDQNHGNGKEKGEEESQSNKNGKSRQHHGEDVLSAGQGAQGNTAGLDEGM